MPPNTEPPAAVGESLAWAGSGPLYKRFIGQWKGKLDYRDYSNDKRVTLPTMLEITLNAPGDAMVFHYTYDDGPGKIVEDREIVSMNAALGRYLEVSDNGKERQEFQAIGLYDLRGEAPAHVVLEGKGEENEKVVDVRITIDISHRTFTILRETKLPGDEFKFRHQYTFDRLAGIKPMK